MLYAARRLVLAVPLLFGMSVLVFALMRLVPGDPAVAVLGYKATPEGVRALREAFHLDEPLVTQYLRWLAGALRGDLGVDFRQNEPIGRMILDRLPVTLELTLLATLGAHPNPTSADVVTRIMADLRSFTAGAKQSDDITVVAARYAPSGR